MTIDQAAAILRRYESVQKGDKALSVPVFGIEFASKIVCSPLDELAERAGLKRSFGTELRKGIRLAQYVVLRSPDARPLT
ncbi:MAG: hypothetical protein AAGI50_09415 [Pseudomonadota bacterium]